MFHSHRLPRADRNEIERQHAAFLREGSIPIDPQEQTGTGKPREVDELFQGSISIDPQEQTGTLCGGGRRASLCAFHFHRPSRADWNLFLNRCYTRTTNAWEPHNTADR